MTIEWRNAVGLLTQERTFAESGAAMLKHYAAQDQTALLGGQKLYAEAKAAFDALVERLLIDLAEDRDPTDSPDLIGAVDAAVAKRVAFSRHVDGVLPDLKGKRSVLLDALAKPVADLVKGLIDGGIAIWKEYRRGDELRRQMIAIRVEAQRWPTFAAIEPGA